MDPLAEIFGTNGLLARHLDGFEARPGQEEMARAVLDLLEGAGDEVEQEAASLVVEAETGLGKTLAYLIPAVLSGLRVVISTKTRNLQDQILAREIPFVREWIDPELTALCVKGRENYLCLYRFNQLRASGQGELFDISAAGRLEEWIGTTRFADRSELSWLSSSSSLWSQVCCQSHFCLGGECPDAAACFLNRLRREAAASRLLVVNHHLLFSDLAVRRGGHGEVLPRYQAVIFDEAHHVESVATQFFGQTISRYQVRDLTADLERAVLSGEEKGGLRDLLPLTQAVLGRMGELVRLFPLRQGRYPLWEVMDREPEIARQRDLLLSALDRLAGALEATGGREPYAQFALRCRDLQERLASICADRFDDEPEAERHYIYWAERREKNLTLSATPIDVDLELRESLFGTVAACVFTSATLSAGGDFSYFLDRLGLDAATPTLSFPSPFDYSRQVLLYVPEDGFPAPNEEEYEDRLHDRIRRLITSAGGRALVLFTSRRAMEGCWDALADELDFPLLRQGEGPRHELLRRFAAETRAVLFAVASFWEGVDIPGESLSLVIIDKLPFEVPSDPVMMARMERIRARGDHPFFAFQVPRAILTLRQGVGRLMRRRGDRGVVAILDIRLFSKGYGGRFRKSLPPAPLVRDLEAVDAFFADDSHG